MAEGWVNAGRDARWQVVEMGGKEFHRCDDGGDGFLTRALAWSGPRKSKERSHDFEAMTPVRRAPDVYEQHAR
jgi:hypothetical protein